MKNTWPQTCKDMLQLPFLCWGGLSAVDVWEQRLKPSGHLWCLSVVFWSSQIPVRVCSYTSAMYYVCVHTGCVSHVGRLYPLNVGCDHWCEERIWSVEVKKVCFDTLRSSSTNEGNSLMFVLSIDWLWGIFCPTVRGSFLLGSHWSVRANSVHWLTFLPAHAYKITTVFNGSAAVGHQLLVGVPHGVLGVLVKRNIPATDWLSHMTVFWRRNTTVLGCEPSNGCMCQLYFCSSGSIQRGSCGSIGRVTALLCDITHLGARTETYKLTASDEEVSSALVCPL